MVKLFLILSLPIHLWTIIFFLRDFAWLVDQRSLWHALGVGAYSMTLALIDSLVVFIVFIVLDSLLPKSWKEDRRLSMLFSIYTVIVLCAALARIFRYYIEQYPGTIERIFLDTAHPLRYFYLVVGLVVVLLFSLITTVVIIHLRYCRIIDRVHAFSDRIIVLSIFYLLLDVAGLIIVLIRITG